MPEIKTVAILGAGAMGAYFAHTFAACPDFHTLLIADGPRADRLRRDGIQVNGAPLTLPVVDPCQAVAPADLILVALKHQHLASAIAGLDPLVDSDTLFLSVMNGLESEEVIAARFGWERVLYAISVGIDAVREGNRITYTKPGKHIFGEAHNETLSEKVLRVQCAFDAAGIRHETPVDMLRMLWWKFMVNVGVNQASAVLRAPYGVFHRDVHAQALMEALMREVVALAGASGIHLTEEDIRDWYPVLRTLSPEGKTSMLQDVEAGRPSEVDVFGGKVLDLGTSLGIDTPVNRTVVQILRAIEKMQ